MAAASGTRQDCRQEAETCAENGSSKRGQAGMCVHAYSQTVCEYAAVFSNVNHQRGRIILFLFRRLFTVGTLQ
jgi:hypothetical protein